MSDLRAEVVFSSSVKNRYGGLDMIRSYQGDILIRSGREAAWWMRQVEDASNPFSPRAEVRASVSGGALFLKEGHCGAPYFHADIVRHTPAPLPTLAQQFWRHPIPFLFDLAPDEFIRRLPNLRVAETRREGEKTYSILASETSGGRDRDTEDESIRGLLMDVWSGVDVWIDAENGMLFRIIFKYWAGEHLIYCQPVRREKIDGLDAVATAFALWRGRPGPPPLEASRLEISNVRINAGVKDEEIRLRVPEDRIARDLFPQPAAVYEKALKGNISDARAWLGLGDLHMRKFNRKAAEEAFHKVIELRPTAPEGYLGVASVLEGDPIAFNRKADVLVQGMNAGVKAPALLFEAVRACEIAHKGPEARRAAEALGRLASQDPNALAVCARLAAGSGAGREALYLRALKIDLKGGVHGAAYYGWLGCKPASEERLEAACLHEEGLAKAPDALWIRGRLLGLYRDLGRLEDARRHAHGIVEYFEKPANPIGADELKSALAFFLGEKDFEGAERLRKAMAAHGQASSEENELLIAAEICAAREDAEGWVRLLNEQVKLPFEAEIRPDGARSHPHVPLDRHPLRGLMSAFERDNKLDTFIERLLKTPVGSPYRQYHDVLLGKIAREFLKGSMAAGLQARLKAREISPEAAIKEEFYYVNTLWNERKHEDALKKLGEILARPGITGADRAGAEMWRARCHLGLGQNAEAVAACDRALEGAEPGRRCGTLLLRGHAQAALGDEERALESYGSALEDSRNVKGLGVRWHRERDSTGEMRNRLRMEPSLRAAERALKREDAGPGLRVVAGLTLGFCYRHAEAARCLEAARGAWIDDPLVLHELAKEYSAIGEIEKALVVRGELLGIARAHPRDVEYGHNRGLFEVDRPILEAVEKSKRIDLAKRFARVLAAEGGGSDGGYAVGKILKYVREEGFIEEIHKALQGSIQDESRRINALHPIADAYLDMGLDAKAVAIYRTFAVDPGKTEKVRSAALSHVERWEKAAEEVADPVVRLRKEYELTYHPLDEVRSLREFLARRDVQGFLQGADRSWREAVRQGKVKPEWRFDLGLVQMELGRKDKAASSLVRGMEAVAELNESKETGTPPLRTRVVNVVGPDTAASVARGLAAAGENRWAWDLRGLFLKEFTEERVFVEKWLRAARPGPDRARARMALAQWLERWGSTPEAVDALAKAGAEEGLDGGIRRDIGRAQVPLLGKLGRMEAMAEASLAFLRAARFDHREIQICLGFIPSDPEKAGRFVAAWDERSGREEPSVGLAIFRARLDAIGKRSGDYRRRMDEAAKLFPEDEEVRWYLADARLQDGDPAGAAGLIEKVLAGGGQRAGDSWTRLALARAYAGMGRREEAVLLIRAVEKDDPRWALESMAAQMGLHDEAVRLYRQRIQANPEEISCRLGLAMALRNAGRAEEAEAEYLKILGGASVVSPTVAREYFMMLPAEGRGLKIARAVTGQIRRNKHIRRSPDMDYYLRESVPEAMRREAADAIEKEPADFDADPMVALAAAYMVHQWAGTPLKALELLDRADRKLPGSAGLLLEKARLLWQLSRHRETAIVYERLAEIDPEGKVTGATASHSRLTALQLYSGAEESGGDVIRLAVEILADAAAGPEVQKESRRLAAPLLARMKEEDWRALRRLKTRDPEGKQAEEVSGLVKKLSDDDFNTRVRAREGLRKIGAPAIPALLRIVDAPDLDLKSQAREIIRQILGG